MLYVIVQIKSHRSTSHTNGWIVTRTEMWMISFNSGSRTRKRRKRLGYRRDKVSINSRPLGRDESMKNACESNEGIHTEWELFTTFPGIETWIRFCIRIFKSEVFLFITPAVLYLKLSRHYWMSDYLPLFNMHVIVCSCSKRNVGLANLCSDTVNDYKIWRNEISELCFSLSSTVNHDVGKKYISMKACMTQSQHNLRTKLHGNDCSWIRGM